MAGNIIYLNGTSSAGKTSIALALQQLLDNPHLRLGIDTFISMIPAKLIGSPPMFAFEETADGFVRTKPEFVQRLRPLVLPTLVALAPANDIIYDDVVVSQTWLRDVVRALEPFNVLFVGVMCPIEILQQRERDRGDRVIGIARGMAAPAHEHDLYDITVDTSQASPGRCAHLILDHLRDGPKPTAFAELRKRFAEST